MIARFAVLPIRMLIRKLFAIAWTIFVIAFGIIPADAKVKGDTSQECPELLQADSYLQATVLGKPGDRAYFYKADRGCPVAVQCRTNIYVVPGNTLIITTIKENWLCAYYQASPQRPLVRGFVEISKLNLPASPQIKASDWIGEWNSPKSDGKVLINMGKKEGTLQIDGEAYFQASDWDRHDGEFSWEGTGNAPTIVVSDQSHGNDRCEVKLFLLANKLLARDNGQCGGQNVSFTGLYFKK